jgi:hypothetical protein
VIGVTLAAHCNYPPWRQRVGITPVVPGRALHNESIGAILVISVR